MTTKSFWANSDGLAVRFGTMPSEERKQGIVDGSPDQTGTAILEFDYVQAMAGITADSADFQRLVIPIGAVIRDVELTVVVAWAGGTGLDVGRIAQDGTGASASAYFANATTGAVGNLTPAGKRLVSTGDADTQISATKATAFTVAYTGTATAGKARLQVHYTY